MRSQLQHLKIRSGSSAGRRSDIQVIIQGHVFQITVLGFLVGLLYDPVLLSLVVDWYTHTGYSYGFLIPLVSGYLLWTKRHQLRDITLKSSGWGFWLLGLGLLLYAMGYSGNEPFTLRLSLVVTLLGVIHLYGGGELLRRVFFPVAYLVLMIPLPYVLYKTIAFYLRLLHAELSVEIIQWLGIPVFQESYFLYLPHIVLEVADVCSGLLSLMSLLAIGIFYAYFTQKGWICRLVLCLAVIPIVIFSNLVRITLTAILVYHFGPGMLENFFHQFHGTVIFLLSLSLLVAFGGFLNWISREIQVRRVS